MRRWQLLIGLGLIVLGLFLVSSFIKPYIYYAFAPTPSEAVPVSKVFEDRLIIPSIKLSTPVLESVEHLRHGVIRYSSSAIPSKRGNVILTGHNTPKHTFDPLFSLLYLVHKDDSLTLHYQNRRYEYRIESKDIVKPGQIGKFTKKTNDRRLTLITCYPPASDKMRLVVVAKQVSAGDLKTDKKP